MLLVLCVRVYIRTHTFFLSRYNARTNTKIITRTNISKSGYTKSSVNLRIGKKILTRYQPSLAYQGGNAFSLLRTMAYIFRFQRSLGQSTYTRNSIYSPAGNRTSWLCWDACQRKWKRSLIQLVIYMDSVTWWKSHDTKAWVSMLGVSLARTQGMEDRPWATGWILVIW